jgi:hypothetical protein
MKYFHQSIVALAVVGISLAGCGSSNSKPVGSEGGACTSGGTCDPGLVCLSKLCVKPGGATGTGTQTTTSTTLGQDAGTLRADGSAVSLDAAGTIDAPASVGNADAAIGADSALGKDTASLTDGAVGKDATSVADALATPDAARDGTSGDGGATSVPHGVFTLGKTTHEPPTHLTGESHEILEDLPGSVVIRFFHNIGGKPGEWKATFTWSAPPATIAPGTVWPFTAKATVVTNVNPLSWSGTVDARAPGGSSILPLNDLGGSKVGVSSADPANTTVTMVATGVAPAGGADFDLHVSAPTGNKDWSADYYYHYVWNP